MSSDMEEVRLIIGKLAEKIKRSKVIMRPQNVARALMGLTRCSADSKEVRFLVGQLARKLEESDRLRMTSAAIADAVYGIQGMSSSIPEVQDLCRELAKKISSTAAELSPEQAGRALFGLQGFSSARSLFEESSIGLDIDDAQFLISALWDKIKIMKTPMPLSAISMGMQGLTLLKDPLSLNIKQFMYVQAIQMGERLGAEGVSALPATDIINGVRTLRLNSLMIPKWLAERYDECEKEYAVQPTTPLSRADKVIIQRYNNLYPADGLRANCLLDGFRLDMNFEDISLNVELDGPSHRYPARARYDRERDEYLKVRKGYEVS
jgi:hypothetical protein